MKITILCNRDLASCVALNHLIPALVDHDISVFMSSFVGGNSAAILPQLQSLKFYEQHLFTDIIWPLLDVSHQHVSGRFHSFAGLSARIGRSIELLNAINQPEGLRRLSDSNPDLIVSIRYGVILRDAVLSIPRLGVLNLHSGRLPQYKGVMATFRALLNGDSRLGTTLHWIDDSSIDTGRIIEVTDMPVSPGKSYLWHVLALYEDGCKSITAAVSKLAQGEPLSSRPQAAGGDYYSFPAASDLVAFERAGWQLVDPVELAGVAKWFMG